MHTGDKRLVIRAPKGQYQVLHLAAHLTGVVAAHVPADQRREAFLQIPFESPFKAPRVRVSAYPIPVCRPACLVCCVANATRPVRRVHHLPRPPSQHLLQPFALVQFLSRPCLGRLLAFHAPAHRVKEARLHRQAFHGLVVKPCPVRLRVLAVVGPRLRVHRHLVDVRLLHVRLPQCRFNGSHPVRSFYAAHPDKRVAVDAPAGNLQQTVVAVVVELLIGQSGFHPVVHAYGQVSVDVLVHGVFFLFCARAGTRTPPMVRVYSAYPISGLSALPSDAFISPP